MTNHEPDPSVTIETGIDPGVDLTFAELSVLPLLMAQEHSTLLQLLGIDTASPGSDLAREGLASMTARRLVEMGDDGPIGLPAVVRLAELITQPEQCVVLEVDEAGQSGSFNVIELQELTVVHRNVTPVIHRFTPLSEGSTVVTLCERIATGLTGAEPAALRIRPTLLGGAIVTVAPVTVDLGAPIAPQVEAALRDPD